MTLKLPHTGQAVIIDIGEADNIHPEGQAGRGQAAGPVGVGQDLRQARRLLRPDVPSRWKCKGDQIVLHFDHVGGGLVAKGEGQLKGFAIAGRRQEVRLGRCPDRRRHGGGQQPGRSRLRSAVRYAWADNPVCNLYNKADLPACPFRTDDWPGVTAGKQ